jgi:hypothetical protein
MGFCFLGHTEERIRFTTAVSLFVPANDAVCCELELLAAGCHPAAHSKQQVAAAESSMELEGHEEFVT